MDAPHQLTFALESAWQTCPHTDCIHTLAVVPGGTFCMQCQTLLDQSIPRSPEDIGYLTADWHYHYILGNPWTTQTHAA
ncbi:MAG: hypothetical protein WCO56_26790 [Verrucomicrobiota bacterium]